MQELIYYACLGLGFLTALVAGVFLSFSDFVMAGLARARPAGGMESMQHINRTVFRSVFLASFLLLVPCTAALAVYVALHADGPGRVLVLAAGVTYVVAVFAVTMLGNVPMNERLDRLNVASDASVAYWLHYRRSWTRLNHLRTLGSALTAALLLAAAGLFAGAS